MLLRSAYQFTFHESPITLAAAQAAQNQGQSMQNPGVLWFMIKQWQFGDQIQDHNRGELRFIQKLLVVGFERQS